MTFPFFTHRLEGCWTGQAQWIATTNAALGDVCLLIVSFTWPRMTTPSNLNNVIQNGAKSSRP